MPRQFEIKRYNWDESERALDAVAEEEPLSIRVQHWRKDLQQTENFAVTMRTPGADRELAVGLLLTEGIIHQQSDFVDVRSLGADPSNEVLVELTRNVDFDEWRQQRNGFMSSSCGICGKARIDQIDQIVPPSIKTEWRVKPWVIEALPGLAFSHQPMFSQTGGLHAAALVSLEGFPFSMFEDIGRHNALDKLIGHATLRDELPLAFNIIFMSSRGSFELVQKAAMAGAQMLVCVGGPSSLAVETARRFGLTLIGFVRENRFNVYSGEWRLDR